MYHKLPRSIWALGVVSLLMDVSSELVHSLLPVLMTSVLGASMLSIGLIEGFAEGIAAITKVFSGALSDYFRRRKFLAVLGYGLAALTKPVFPLASSLGWVFAARFTDRIGKGIRGAPRDALVADIAPPELRGAAYGLRQSLDSVGAFLGPLLAIAGMILLAQNLRAVLWLAVLPAFLAVFMLLVAVKEPDRKCDTQTARRALNLRTARSLPASYWFVVLLGGVFSLARFSEAFLILRAQEVGLSISLVPLVMIVMNLVYSALAYPAGIASDRLPARPLLAVGLVVLVLADLTLAIADTYTVVMGGVALWGLHLALTQGLLSKLVADSAPSELRGTAFGVFHLISGLMLILASVLAGFLWKTQGAAATFYAGALFAGIATLGLLCAARRVTQDR